MVVPPPKDPSRPEVRYDSAVDLCENSSILARPGDRLHGTHAVLQGSRGNHESREEYMSEIKIFWSE